MTVKNRLTALMGERQAKTNKPVTPVDVADAVGLSRQAIHKWIHNQIASYPADTVDKLCEYFDCEVGELLYRVKETEQN